MFESVNPGWDTPPWGEFGSWRVHGRHRGIDYYVPRRSPVFASGDGEVSRVAFAAGGLGWYCDITYAEYWVRVAHFESRPDVSEGERVTALTRLGTAGQTGNAEGIEWRGLVHPHTEVRKNGSNLLQSPRVVLRPLDRTMQAGSGTSPLPLAPPEETELDVFWLKHEEDEAWYLIAPGVATQIITNRAEATLVSQVIMKGKSAQRATAEQITALSRVCQASIPSTVTLPHWLKHDSKDEWYLLAPGVRTQVIRGHADAALISQTVMSGRSARRASEAQIAALRALCEAGVGLAQSANLQPVLDAIGKVPTAEQNGQAARAAIVR